MTHKAIFGKCSSCTYCDYDENVLMITPLCRYNPPTEDGWPEVELDAWCRCYKRSEKRLSGPKTLAFNEPMPD